MKHIYFKLFFFMLALITIPACNMIQEVDSKDLTEGSEKLVVYGFISPQDTAISVEVSMARPVVGTVYYYDDQYNYQPFDFVEDAQVTISDGNNEATLIYKMIPGVQEYNVLKYSYQISTKEYPIVAGRTYFLTVNGRGQTVTAQCTVPSEAPEMTAELYTYMENASYCDEFGCNSGEIPFYGAAAEWTPNDSRYYYFASYLYNDNDTGDEFPGIISYTYASKTYDKEIFNEGEIKENIELGIWEGIYDHDGDLSNNKRQAILYLSAVDEGYYRYQKSINQYQQSEPDNPFAEPVPIYTNIEGGFGVFAAYNPDKLVIDLPNKIRSNDL